jgi:hypothetical protein
MSEKTVRHPHLFFKRSMTWEGEVEAFVQDHLKGYSLNAPCGSSKLGSVRLDIDPSLNPDKIGDINKLPFPDCVFNSAVQDPRPPRASVTDHKFLLLIGVFFSFSTTSFPVL